LFRYFRRYQPSPVPQKGDITKDRLCVLRSRPRVLRTPVMCYLGAIQFCKLKYRGSIHFRGEIMQFLKSSNLSIKRAISLLLVPLMLTGTAAVLSSPASANTPQTYSVTVKETVNEDNVPKEGIVVEACYNSGANQWECVDSVASDVTGVATLSGVNLANSTGWIKFSAGGPDTDPNTTDYSKAEVWMYFVNGQASNPQDLVLRATTWVEAIVKAKYSTSNSIISNAQVKLIKTDGAYSDGNSLEEWSTTDSSGNAKFTLDSSIWGSGQVTANLEEVAGLHGSDSKPLNLVASPAVSAELVVTPLYIPGVFEVELREYVEGVDSPVIGMTVKACHSGSGNHECSQTAVTGSDGKARFNIALPDKFTGYISFSAGGPTTNYSETWSGQYLVNGFPQWRQYPTYTSRTTWIPTTVTVVKAGSNLPVRNVGVKLSTPEDGWTRTQYVTTNSQGTVTVSLDANHWGGSRAITAQIESWSGYSSDPTPVTKAGSGANMTASVQLVTTSLSYTLTGTITDSNGQPFASKAICISYSSNQNYSSIDEVTNSGGFYSVEDVSGASVYYRPGSCDDYESGNYDYIDNFIYPNTKPATVTNNIQLSRTGVKLTVTDTSGKPASFVPVQLKDGSIYPQERVTDQFGVAYFTGLTPGKSYTAAYKRETYSYDPLRFEDKENTSSVSPRSRNDLVEDTLILSRLPGSVETPVTVSGKLVTINGSPVPNGQVYVTVYQSSGNNWSYIQSRVSTDAEGKFSISNLPYGQVNINLSATGYRSTYSYFETSAAKGKTTYELGDFQMRTQIRGNFSYSGVLRDNEGEPIPDMKLVMHGSSQGSITVDTDPTGAFTFEGLTSGWYGIYAQSWYEDYEWSYWNFNLAGTVIDADLTLNKRPVFTGESNASISGNVSEYLDVNGPSSAVPVVGACIYAYSTGAGMGWGRATTDANGNWSISGLSDGEEYYYYLQDYCSYDAQRTGVRFDYENKYEYPIYQSTLLAKDASGVPGEILLKEVSDSGSGSVSGRVKDADDYSNLSGVAVSISRAKGGIVIQPVVTDSRGEYSFPNLPAGDYYLQIGSYEEEVTHNASWMSVEVGTDDNRVNAFLTRISSSGLAGSVSGTVFDEFGKPHGSGGVNIWDPASNTYYGWTNTDNSGEFTIEGLPVGVNLMMSILPQWQELAEFFAEITISSGSSFVVNRIDLKTVATISGQVSGLPLARDDTSIHLYAELVDKTKDRVLQATWVDPNTGQYVFDRVPEGKFVVRFTQNPFDSGWHDGGYFVGGSEANVFTVKPVYWDRTKFGTTDFSSATEIDIRAGDTRRAINVEVSPGSALIGQLSVATPDGTSLLSGTRQVGVTAYQKRSNGQWRQVAFSYVSGATNSTFLIAGLAAGSYKLEFFDYRKGSNSLATSYNGGASTLEEAPEILVGETGRVIANHTMTIAPPEKSAEAFDLDDLGAEKLSELKDEISLAESAVAGSEIEIFVGTEFAGEFVSAFANSTPVVLGDWQQVNSKGFIKVKIPTTLSAGSHRIAAQDSRGIVFGWAPITIKSPDAVVANPASAPSITKAKPKASKPIVESEPEAIEKESSETEEAVATPVATESSNGDWLLPLAAGFLMVVVAGSAWVLRSRRGSVSKR
jgi:protocatechuate 3,4-dioxygenase beta subunit